MPVEASGGHIRIHGAVVCSRFQEPLDAFMFGVGASSLWRCCAIMFGRRGRKRQTSGGRSTIGRIPSGRGLRPPLHRSCWPPPRAGGSGSPLPAPILLYREGAGGQIVSGSANPARRCRAYGKWDTPNRGWTLRPETSTGRASRRHRFAIPAADLQEGSG